MARCSVLVVLGVCAAAPLLAQAPPSLTNPPVSVVRQSVGAWQTGEVIRGEGAGYRVSFDRQGVSFAPALAARADRDVALRYRLREVRRAGAAGVAVELAVPQLAVDGRTIRYARGSVVERYELRPEGVEQSFVFDALPPGHGDLVVRGRLETALPLTASARDELRFDIDGVAGVRIGKAVGIDARGATAEGFLRLAGGVLEISLPAAFVDRAALPLTVDPLLGSTMTFGSTNDDELPDVAYDATNDVYLVVWNRNGVGVRAQRVRGTGALVGGTIAVRNGAAYRARVGNVNKTNAFAVAWHENNYVWAAGVNAGTGAVSAAVQVSGYQASTPDVGSAATLTDDEVMIAYNVFQPSHWIEAALVRIPTTGTPSVTGTRALSSGGGFANETQAAISRSGGSTGNFLVVWVEDFTNQNVLGIIVDRDLQLLSPILTIAQLPEDEFEPAVDGDGTSWLVAYSVVNTAPTLNYDLWCRGVYLPPSGQAYLSPSAVELAGSRVSEHYPSVAWLGSTALVAYAEEGELPILPWGKEHDIRLKSVDPFLCTECEGTFPVTDTDVYESFPRLASQRAGGASGPGVLVVWHHNLQTTDDDVMARRFEADGGVETDLGGGCGAGGTTRATCANAGNPTFVMRLRHAAATRQALFALSSRAAMLPCGACTLVPDPAFGVTFNAGITDAQGNLAITASLPATPSIVGARLYQQFLVMGSSCFGVDLSNGIVFEIQ